jgi:hypothetical protein
MPSEWLRSHNDSNRRQCTNAETLDTCTEVMCMHFCQHKEQSHCGRVAGKVEKEITTSPRTTITQVTLPASPDQEVHSTKPAVPVHYYPLTQWTNRIKPKDSSHHMLTQKSPPVYT